MEWGEGVGAGWRWWGMMGVMGRRGKGIDIGGDGDDEGKGGAYAEDRGWRGMTEGDGGHGK